MEKIVILAQNTKTYAAYCDVCGLTVPIINERFRE